MQGRATKVSHDKLLWTKDTQSASSWSQWLLSLFSNITSTFTSRYDEFFFSERKIKVKISLVWVPMAKQQYWGKVTMIYIRKTPQRNIRVLATLNGEYTQEGKDNTSRKYLQKGFVIAIPLSWWRWFLLLIDFILDFVITKDLLLIERTMITMQRKDEWFYCHILNAGNIFCYQLIINTHVIAVMPILG